MNQPVAKGNVGDMTVKLTGGLYKSGRIKELSADNNLADNQ